MKIIQVLWYIDYINRIYKLGKKNNLYEEYRRLLLCYAEKDLTARNFYIKHGFRHNGNSYEDEIEMKFNLEVYLK